MPDNSGAVNLGETTPEAPEKDERVLTAFGVVIGFDGNPQVVEYNPDGFAVAHPPTPDLVFGACSIILKDLTATETAQASAHNTVQLQMAQAQAIAQQQQEMALRQHLDLPGARRG